VAELRDEVRDIVDTALAPDPDSVEWINPRLRPGEERKVLTGIPGKTGLVYTLDRETGQFLWARSTVEQNVIADINVESGAATVNPDTLFTAAGQTRTVCPTMTGGKNYPSGTYSPQTQAMYYPLQNTCMTISPTISRPRADSLYGIRSSGQIAPGAAGVGSIHAISVETGRTLWTYDQRAGVLSLMSTAGGLLFGGDANGRFRALDQETGEVLWEVNLGSPVTGYPISFAVDGRQYLAVSTGSSLAGQSMLSLTPELRPSTGNNLFVFALPERG
ncbi:MAG: outer membrane protein assembly factor BamB family protein, partial [Gammaproteobacteria bacterium]